MSDIVSYSSDLLLEFLDEIHKILKKDLSEKFGQNWIKESVIKHIGQAYLDKTILMLESPMRTVDMNKNEDELYGVEHLFNIISGNWEIFKDRLKDREKVCVYLKEITELRHNISHRRSRHLLRRTELLRFIQNARILLTALSAKSYNRFAEIENQISAGGTPWGNPLQSSLPPKEEIFQEFIGRPAELESLGDWLGSDSRKVLVWGYGGAGKSAIAFQFAKEVEESSRDGLSAVCWVSAKRQEFVDGGSRDKKPDFYDVSSFVEAVWMALYGATNSDDNTLDALIYELKETPILLVIDDLDTVLGNEELAHALLFELPSTKAKIIYTSRQTVPGIKTIEVKGFQGDDLNKYIQVRAIAYELDPATCMEYSCSIASVTNGYPLYIDDLLRYSRIDGLKESLSDWSNRKGDTAREYSLRRQLTHICESAGDVLVSICAVDRPITALEISRIVGRPDDDVAFALRELERWRLISRIVAPGEDRPGFDANRNTKRLVQVTFSHDTRLSAYRTAFVSMSSERMSTQKRNSINAAIGQAKSIALRGDIATAVSHLKLKMVGELQYSSELFGMLGWIYSIDPNKGFIEEARTAFREAIKHSKTNEFVYYEWAQMENEFAESGTGGDDRVTRDAWKRACEIAERGIDAGCESVALRQMAGYGRSREAKTLARLNEFTAATAAYERSGEHFRRALHAPASKVREIPKGLIYRGLVISLEGLNKESEIASVMNEWQRQSGSDEWWQREMFSLRERCPSIFYSGDLL